MSAAIGIREGAQEPVVSIEKAAGDFVEVRAMEKSAAEDFQRTSLQGLAEKIYGPPSTIGAIEQLPPAITVKLHVASKTYKQTGDVDELARHSKLDIPNRRTLLSPNPTLVCKINRHSAPVSGEIVKQKPWHPVFSILLNESRVFQNVAVEDVLADSVLGFSSA
jgi:hypothetical protein